MNKKLIVLFSCLLMISTVNVFSSGSQDSRSEDSRPENPQMGNNNGPDFEKVAEELGITVEVLMDALGTDEQGSPEQLKEAAAKLGITEQELMEAMGPPPMGPKK
jgi:hypothetical protein